MRGGVDKKMINYKRLMKNRKAISPIFATLILIAIAVIAGIVVYMFTSGTIATMTGGGNAAQEKVAVQGFAIDSDGAYSVYAQTTNGQPVTVNSIIIKDSAGNTVGVSTDMQIGTNDPILAADGSLATLTGTSTALTLGNSYTATLTTAKGGSFVSSSATAVAP
jgi:flagellin-like protein